MIPLVDLKKQYYSIKKEIDSSISEILENTAFIKGKSVENFEKTFALMHNVKHCIGVGNGTDALIISLKALGIGSGDEVIVPANSFIASSEAVTAVGAKVVFADCHPDFYTVDIEEIKKNITEKTKAVIVVHLYGQPAQMEEILKISSEYNLKIIEDAAQAHLAEYKIDNKWAKVGKAGHFTTFSFYPGKNLGAYGDGGAIVTNDDNLAKLARMYANHGRIAKYNHEMEGFNSRLDGIQAAVLNVKLNYIEEWSERRREIANRYILGLSSCENIILPALYSNSKAVWHLFVIRVKNRPELQSYLKENGISTGIHYPIALPNLKAYEYLGYSAQDFPFASKYQNEILSLPIFPELENEEIDFICNKITEFYNN